MNLICEICKNEIAGVGSVIQPIQGSMFHPLAPHLPMPFNVMQQWQDMRCPYCHYRPIIEEHKILTTDGFIDISKEGMSIATDKIEDIEIVPDLNGLINPAALMEDVPGGTINGSLKVINNPLTEEMLAFNKDAPKPSIEGIDNPHLTPEYIKKLNGLPDDVKNNLVSGVAPDRADSEGTDIPEPTTEAEGGQADATDDSPDAVDKLTGQQLFDMYMNSGLIKQNGSWFEYKGKNHRKSDLIEELDEENV